MKRPSCVGSKLGRLHCYSGTKLTSSMVSTDDRVITKCAGSNNMCLEVTASASTGGLDLNINKLQGQTKRYSSRYREHLNSSLVAMEL